MHGRYVITKHRTDGEPHPYPFYRCINDANRYNACPELPCIRADRINQLVWEDCCRVFERLELIRDTIEFNIERSLQNILEDTQGKALMDELREKIQFAYIERDKHPKGDYYYLLISADIQNKEAELQRYEEQYQESINIVKLKNIYQQSTHGFLNFLTFMQGRYDEATFAQKRNALDVLGVRVYVHPDTYEAPEPMTVDTEEEWLAVKRAAKLAGIALRTLRKYIERGNLATHPRTIPMTVIHRDELARYLKVKQPHINLEQYKGEWFTVNKLSRLGIIHHQTLRRAIAKGEVKALTQEVSYPAVHRDELNRFLRENPIRTKAERENIAPRIEVQYSPIFTSVQSSAEYGTPVKEYSPTFTGVHSSDK